VKELCEEVLKHLEEDRKTWIDLSRKAYHEAFSDEILMEKIRKVI
jgi:hypothetical protein